MGKHLSHSDHSMSDLSVLVLKGNLPNTFQSRAWALTFITLLHTINNGLNRDFYPRNQSTLSLGLSCPFPATSFSPVPGEGSLGSLLQGSSTEALDSIPLLSLRSGIRNREGGTHLGSNSVPLAHFQGWPGSSRADAVISGNPRSGA